MQLQSVKVPFHALDLGYLCSHLRVDALILLGDLVYDKLGVALHEQAADPQPNGGSQPGKETLVFGMLFVARESN